MKFFKSKYVKIFPCSRRGTYTITTESESETVTNSYVFDPEARMASEYNFTHLPGMNRGSKSYVSELSILPVPGSSPEESIAILSVVINGYYFELTFCSDALVALYTSADAATGAGPTSCPTNREGIKALGKLRIYTEAVSVTDGNDHETKRDLQYLGSVLWPAYNPDYHSRTIYHASTSTEANAYEIKGADLKQLGVDLPLGEDASDFICTAICIVPSNNTADPPTGGKYFELDLNEDSNWVLRYQLGYDSAEETLEIAVISS